MSAAGRSLINPSSPPGSSSASPLPRHSRFYTRHIPHRRATAAASGVGGGGGGVGGGGGGGGGVGTSSGAGSIGAGGVGAMIPPAAAIGALTQLMDDDNHRKCSEGNKKALLAETLNRLRGLAKEFEEDDWMYDGGVSGTRGVGGGAGLDGDYWSRR